MVENGKKHTDEGKDGHDVSSGSLVNSSNLCLKRHPANNKYTGKKIRSSPKELVQKMPGPHVIRQRDNAA